MEIEKLNEILEKHNHWIEKDCKGWESMRADLTGANLSRANLYGANLSGADLYRANLSRASLSRASLSGADLTGANLSGADLFGANLSGADLYGTNMYRANLSGANLYGASLYGANLSGANLSGAGLSGANLSGAKNIPLIPYACPDFGMFIGWKKASGKIVCLEIPEDAKRLSETGRKCRCNKAKVLNITEIDGSPCGLTEIASSYDSDFIYKVGEVVTVPNFCEDRWKECSAGIHFFINRREAVEYNE